MWIHCGRLQWDFTVVGVSQMSRLNGLVEIHRERHLGAFNSGHAAYVGDLLFGEARIAREDEFGVGLLKCRIIKNAHAIAGALPAGIGNVVDHVLLYVGQATGKYRVVQAL